MLNHSVKAKRCRIHLFKRHRFAIANFKYHLLVNSSLRLDFFLYDVALSLASGSSIVWIYCSFLLIVMTSLLTSSSLIPDLALLLTADCDDITADVIIADSRSCTSC
ncbi:hypothetical protein F511_41765 [Dorcoceras hygrometricum]|uniref:Uncharacterized protein n=1 Tax=Dorcoceras hygrometricum TaxID=472368 RepID=A0A2Z7D355_9LAMI|nr:hypothetical protein F511_41765 [Dorcoceras hygrometricum]